MPTLKLIALTLLLAAGPRQANLDAALLRAVGREDAAAARRLLASGASARARTADERKTPALNEAVDRGSLPLVRLLLAHGADVRAADSDGNTALSTAVDDIDNDQFSRAQGLPIVQALLAGGSDLHTKNESGYTPVRLAQKFGPEWLIRALRAPRRQKKGGR